MVSKPIEEYENAFQKIMHEKPSLGLPNLMKFILEVVAEQNTLQDEHSDNRQLQEKLKSLEQFLEKVRLKADGIENKLKQLVAQKLSALKAKVGQGKKSSDLRKDIEGLVSIEISRRVFLFVLENG